MNNAKTVLIIFMKRPSREWKEGKNKRRKDKKQKNHKEGGKMEKKRERKLGKD
jgi:hypothetical protein